MCSTIILPFLYIKIQFLDIMYQSDMLLTGYLYALNHSIGCMKLYNHVIVVIISRSRSVVVLSLYNQGVWQYKIGWWDKHMNYSEIHYFPIVLVRLVSHGCSNTYENSSLQKNCKVGWRGGGNERNRVVCMCVCGVVQGLPSSSNVNILVYSVFLKFSFCKIRKINHLCSHLNNCMHMWKSL